VRNPLADPDKRRNLLERVISAVVLLPVAIWLTVQGGWAFAGLVGVAAALCAAELLLMAGPLGAAEAWGIAVAGLIPLLAAVPGPVPSWAVVALALGAVALLSILLLGHRAIEEVPARAGRWRWPGSTAASCRPRWSASGWAAAWTGSSWPSR